MPRNHHSSKAAKQRKALRPSQVWSWVILGFGVIIVAAFLLLRLTPYASAEISVAQAHEKLQQGTLFLDVRTQAEWDQGHIAGSTLIPLDQLPARLAEIPKDQDVVVICRSGARAREGAAILRSAGYMRIFPMTGGLIAWKAAGYALDS